MKIAALKEAMRVPNHDGQTFQDQGFALYDLFDDPNQKAPIRDSVVESRLYAGLLDIFQEIDAPEESYTWYGLKA